MKAVLLKAWDGTNEPAEVFEDESIQSVPWKKMYNRLAMLAKRLADYPLFDKTVTAVILMAGVLVGAQTYDHFAEDACSGSSCDVLQLVMRQGAFLDSLILIVFTVEVVVKICAEAFAPLHYFASGWNRFDFLIVFGSYLGQAGLLGSAGSLLVVLRLLRLLRILKLVKSLPQLQVIVIALLKGFKSIGFIGIILFMCFYIFAIAAMILFSENDPFHFGTLHAALVSLFRASTLEDWTDIMYINMYGCESYGYNVNAEYTDPVSGVWGRYDKIQGCNDPFKFATRSCFQSGGCSKGYGLIAALFFVIFVVIGALVLLTLFIGVITTSMEEASDDMKKEAEVFDRVEEIRATEGATQDIVDLYYEVFQMLDFDGSLCIEAEELMMGLKMVGREPSPSELHKMMRRVDENDSGEIDFAEFVQFMFNLKHDSVERRASFVAMQSPTSELLAVAKQPTKMTAEEMLNEVETVKPMAVKARGNQVVPEG